MKSCVATATHNFMGGWILHDSIFVKHPICQTDLQTMWRIVRPDELYMPYYTIKHFCSLILSYIYVQRNPNNHEAFNRNVRLLLGKCCKQWHIINLTLIQPVHFAWVNISYLEHFYIYYLHYLQVAIETIQTIMWAISPYWHSTLVYYLYGNFHSFHDWSLLFIFN